MTPEQVLAWRARLGMTQPQAADALGVSLRMYKYYETGRREDGRPATVEKRTRLAMAAIEAGVVDPDENE